VSGNLWIRESFINATDNVLFGQSPPFETFTDHRGELFRELRSEYGRCISRVYIDRPGQEPLAIGWVFHGRDHDSDQPQRSYLREVWVTVHSPEPSDQPADPSHELDGSAETRREQP